MTNNKKVGVKRSQNHVFPQLREQLLVQAPGPTPGSAGSTASTNASGSGSGSWILNPLGITGATLSGSTFTYTYGNVVGPPLRGLYNRAVDFQWYRVSRAKFVFVSSVGSTTPGQMTLSAYTDPLDVGNLTYPAYSSSGSTKVFDLATVATREASIPIPVDSSWKKVSSMTVLPGNSYPFVATSASTLVCANSVADLCFGAVSATWTSNVVSGNLGAFFIEYDVEFKSPIDPAVNA